MLLLIVLIALLLSRRRYGYSPYYSDAYYRGHGPYGPACYGVHWNGHAWQPGYVACYGSAGSGTVAHPPSG